jgi:ferrochelatase
MEREKIGVVLLQFGGPDSLDAVEPFLYNLFCDPDIVQLPFGMWLQRPLAKYVSSRRADSIKEKYGEIGGKSPIIEKSEEQRLALERELQRRFPEKEIVVKVAMRYWKPFTKQIVEELQSDGVKKVVLLPLYAHYSISNAGSSMNEWDRTTAELGVSFAERRIKHYHLNEKYLAALNERIDQALATMQSPTAAFLLFSAHGTPVDMMEAGDPYARQVRESMEALMKARNYDHSYTLAFQSKVGPKQWLTPATPDTMEELAHLGIRSILVIPIAFVSDHIETLHELDIELREEAEHEGVTDFAVMRGLNDSQLFIDGLADLVSTEIAQL